MTQGAVAQEYGVPSVGMGEHATRLNRLVSGSARMERTVRRDPALADVGRKGPIRAPRGGGLSELFLP
jgi:hypothetical protein